MSRKNSLPQRKYSDKACDVLLELLAMDRSAPEESIEKVDKLAVAFTKNIQKIWNTKRYHKTYDRVISDSYFTGLIELPNFEDHEKVPRPPTPEPAEAMQIGCPDTPKVSKPKVPRVLWANREPNTQFKDAAKVRKLVEENGIPQEAMILAAAQTSKTLGQGEFSNIIRDILKHPNLAKQYQKQDKTAGNLLTIFQEIPQIDWLDSLLRIYC